jgi:cytochrome c peroxidase
MNGLLRVACAGGLALSSLACSEEAAPAAYVWNLPKGFPVPAVPEDNPMSAAKVELGRFLFYDTQSCASCHRQELAFTDGRGTAVGSTGQAHRRGSMSLANVAYASSLTWANPHLQTLERQALVPLFGEDPVELGLAGQEEPLLQRLSEDARYPALFAAAFPEEPRPVSLDAVVRGLAAFQRTLLSGHSPFDRYTYGGEADALSTSAKRGMVLFFSERLECFHCHQGVFFSDAVKDADTTFPSLPFHTGARGWHQPVPERVHPGLQPDARGEGGRAHLPGVPHGPGLPHGPALLGPLRRALRDAAAPIATGLERFSCPSGARWYLPQRS